MKFLFSVVAVGLFIAAYTMPAYAGSNVKLESLKGYYVDSNDNEVSLSGKTLDDYKDSRFKIVLYNNTRSEIGGEMAFVFLWKGYPYTGKVLLTSYGILPVNNEDVSFPCPTPDDVKDYVSSRHVTLESIDTALNPNPQSKSWVFYTLQTMIEMVI